MFVDGRWTYQVLTAYWVIVIFLPWTYGYMGATMGVAQPSCDDAKTNLVVDWDYSFTAYTCMGFSKWKSNPEISPVYYTIPNFNAKKDQVWHYCMNTSILYKDRPPIRGHHRPLWAKYGEYLYVPPQRWLHNLEHGSIVMLYHPCAEEEQVHKLRQLVTSCLWRHVITPYDKLSNDRPLALVAWGAKLEMNTVDVIQAILFMQKHAHVAPEDLSKEGQYDELQLHAASLVSDKDDKAICPWVPTTSVNSDKSQTGHLSRNMFFGAAANNNQFRRPSGIRRSRSPELVRGQSDDLRRNRRTFVDVMNLAEKYNGPNFVSDVLPPQAVQQLYQQPSYVVAGSFLGNNPLHPNTMTQGTAPPTGQPGGSQVAGPPPPPPPAPAPSPGGAPGGNTFQPPPNSNSYPNGPVGNSGIDTPPDARFMAPGSGSNPAEVLAAMAMLMRKDGDTTPSFPQDQLQHQFESASNNFRYPQQQQQFAQVSPQQPQPNFFQGNGRDQQQQFQGWQNRNPAIWARTASMDMANPSGANPYQSSGQMFSGMAPGYGNNQQFQSQSQQMPATGMDQSSNDMMLQRIMSSMAMGGNGNQKAAAAMPMPNGQNMNNDQSLMLMSAFGGGRGGGFRITDRFV